jgi:hypothetical protein
MSNAISRKVFVITDMEGVDGVFGDDLRATHRCGRERLCRV